MREIRKENNIPPLTFKEWIRETWWNMTRWTRPAVIKTRYGYASTRFMTRSQEERHYIEVEKDLDRRVSDHNRRKQIIEQD